MQQLVEQASRETGQSEIKVREALRALLGFLQDCCQPASFSRLLQEVPELSEVRPPPSRQGFLASLFGGGNMALMALPGKLQQIGFDDEAMKKLLPLVLRWLKEKASPGLWRELEGQLPSVLRMAR